jgi:hypothetical protein
MNALTVRRLFGFAAITEAVCHQRRIRCAESPPTEITRVLLGGPAPKGRAAKKAVTLQRVRALGFAVEDDDEADAVSLWLFAEGVFSPAMLSQRRAAAGLELNLHPRKTNAPRGKPRSALGVTTATMEPDHGSLDTNKNIDGKFQFQFAQV